MKRLITRFKADKGQEAGNDGTGMDGFMDEFIDDLCEGLDGSMEDEDTVYVKPFDIEAESAVEGIKKELDKGNIIVLDISRVRDSKTDLYNQVRGLVKYCEANGFGMCSVSKTKIIMLPAGMEIAGRG